MAPRVRDIIRSFEPYQWEPSNEEIASKFGLRPEQIVRFDTNSSPYVPVEWLSKLSGILLDIGINDYPESSYKAFREAISRYVGTDIEKITVTNGADEALDIVAKAFIERGTSILISAPTYSMYRVVSEIMNGRVMNVLRLPDFRDNVEGLLKVSAREGGVIFLCSPNNPTGNTTSRADIIRLLDESRCLVVVDESYFEFSGKTFLDLTDKYDNLVIVRTFSKGFSMAGVRVGYIIAYESTVSYLNRVRPPNSISVISLSLAEIALNNIPLMKGYVDKIVRERERFIKRLSELKGVHLYPTEANFVLIRLTETKSSDVSNDLLRRGIVVRDVCGLPMLENCLRFSVRTQSDDDRLLEALEEVLV